MSNKKGGGGDFQNPAARRFRKAGKIDRMSQAEIYRILDKDIMIILDQVTKARNHENKYPDYVANAFANLATAMWFKEFVDDNVKVKKKTKLRTDLTEDQILSLMSILSDVYRKSFGNTYSQQVQDYAERNLLVTKAFIKLCPKLYHRTSKLKGLSEETRRDLTIQIYGDPIPSFRHIHRKINESTVSDEKKLKFLQDSYGDRFPAAVGAAMTVEGNNSDCLAMLFDYIMSKKKKKRGPYLQAYAEAYKTNLTRYFRIDHEFYKKNKRLIKLLAGRKKHPKEAVDVGYRKAFKEIREPKKEIPSDRKRSWEMRRERGFVR